MRLRVTLEGLPWRGYLHVDAGQEALDEPNADASEGIGAGSGSAVHSAGYGFVTTRRHHQPDYVEARETPCPPT